MRYTLNKSEILKGKQNLQKVFNSGTKLNKNLLSCIYYTEKAEDFQNKTLVGFTVNKKIKSAVLRNRCKRLMRESYRLNKHILNFQTKNFYNIFIIFYFRKLIQNKNITFQEVSKEIIDFLHLIRIEILTKKQYENYSN